MQGHFDTVEVGSTFYGCPKARTANNWNLRVPEIFIFSELAPLCAWGDKKRVRGKEFLQKEVV
jgi:hypothetical protein